MTHLGRFLPALLWLWRMVLGTIGLGLFVSFLWAVWTGAEWRPHVGVRDWFWSHWVWLLIPIGLLITLAILTILALWGRRHTFDPGLLGAATVARAGELRVGLRPGASDVTIPDYRPEVRVQRKVDLDAREAFERCEGLVVIGRPQSGKTRTAWELLQPHPNTLVDCAPNSEPR